MWALWCYKMQKHIHKNEHRIYVPYVIYSMRYSPYKMNIACCVQSKHNVINSASSNTYVSVCIYVIYQSHCNVNVKYTGIYCTIPSPMTSPCGHVNFFQQTLKSLMCTKVLAYTRQDDYFNMMYDMMLIS